MKKQCSFSLVLILIFALSALGQESDIRTQRVEIVEIKAEVIGILEGHRSLAVLQIIQPDSLNHYQLEKGQEILVEFYFGTQKLTKEPKLPGLKGGEIIMAQLNARQERGRQNKSYRVFKYRVLRENPADEEDDPPRR